VAKFYTNIEVRGKTVYHRYVEDGVRKQEKTGDFSPTLFIRSDNDVGFKDIFGTFVKPKLFDTISDAKQFLKEMKGVSGMDVYGSQDYELLFANEVYPGEIEYDLTKVRTGMLDIEVSCPDGAGFPHPTEAAWPINLITIHDSFTDTFYVFGEKPYKPKQANVKYLCEPDEKERLLKFVTSMQTLSFDVISGWYSNTFDIPYIFKRLENLFGENTAAKLSPWGRYEWKNLESEDRKPEIEIAGVQLLDYLELYKKHVPGEKESYKLDYIGFLELGLNKISYDEEYGSIYRFANANWELFVDYNIRDVEIPLELDKKKNLIAVQMMLAYTAKINYTGAYGPVGLWTAIIHAELSSRNMVLPPSRHTRKDEQYEGAFVKETIPGFYRWVTCFDFTSLYPTIMASYNISPESLIRYAEDLPEIVRPYWRQNITDEMCYNSLPPEVTAALKAHKLCIAGNGEIFRTDIDAVIPRLVRKMFAARRAAKKQMLECKKIYEADNTRTDMKALAGILSVKEQAYKICLNSLYGAFGSEWFCLFEVCLAAAVTLSGQGYIRHCERKFNEYLSNITGKRDYIIAIDTDSLYINLGPLQEKFGLDQQALTHAIDTKLQDLAASYIDNVVDVTGVTNSIMGLKREKIISVAVFVKKKRYVGYAVDNEGVVYAEPDFFVTGLASKSSATPRRVRSSLEDVYKLILARDEAGLIDYVNRFKLEYKSLPIDVIAYPRGVNDIGKWKGPNDDVPYISRTPIHVRASIMHNLVIKKKGLQNHIQDISDGMKIKFVYIDERNPTHEDVIGFTGNKIPDEFGLDQFIDHDMMFDKSFIEPVKVVCEIAGLNYKKQNEASSYF